MACRQLVSCECRIYNHFDRRKWTFAPLFHLFVKIVVKQPTTSFIALAKWAHSNTFVLFARTCGRRFYATIEVNVSFGITKMPIASVKNVYAVSSEDKAYPATNLLSNADKKWKCESPPPSSIFVILQFERPTKIIGIDIGNEHSTFIEVFVGKNGWLPDKYQQILLSTSFMTAMESRNSTSTNRVKCFAKAALDATVCEQKWDLIKVVCSQTFNKHVQYGLSFVKVHCVDDGGNKPAEKANCETLLNLPVKNVFAQFKIRESTPDSDEDAGGSSTLFQKWKQSKTVDPDANETIVKPTNGE